MNAAVAFAALIEAGLRPDPRAVGDALARVEWPGRFQILRDGRTILDGAHNPAASARLVETWREEFADEKATAVFGMLADKDAPAVSRNISQIASRIICVPTRSPRAVEPRELAATVTSVSALPCTTADTLAAGLEQAESHGDRILVTGSLSLVGEALAHFGLMPGAYESSAQ